MSKTASISESCGIVCTEVFDEGSNPSQEEIERYALKIGLNPSGERHLLYLAKEGLMEPLPKHWKPVCDENTGAFYYYNKNTRQTQWDHPVDEKYKQKVNIERTKLQLNAKITSFNEQQQQQLTNRTNSTTIDSSDIFTSKSKNQPDIETNKPRKLGRFSDKHLLQNTTKLELDRLSNDISKESSDKIVHFDLDKNYKYSISESDGESKISTDITADGETNFIKDIQVQIKDKLDANSSEKMFNRNDNTKILKPIKKTDLNMVGRIKENFNNKDSSDRYPGYGNVKSLQSRFSALTNPFKKIPPLGHKTDSENDISVDKDDKSNASKSFEEKLKNMSEKLNTGIVDAKNSPRASLKNDELIRKKFVDKNLEDDAKISKDESMHSLLKKFEVNRDQRRSSKNDEKSVLDLLDEHAIDEQTSAISLSYCNTDQSKQDSKKEFTGNSAKVRRNLFYTKMTDAIRAKPLSMDTDSETDSLNKNKRHHKLIIADDMDALNTSKSKTDISEKSSHKEPLKAFRTKNLESGDESTALDCSMNLSNSEGNSKISERKNDLIDLISKDNVSDVLEKTGMDDDIFDTNYVQLLMPEMTKTNEVVRQNSNTSLKLLDTDKMEKSNEISKTSSDTSVESQIQSNLGVLADVSKDFNVDLMSKDIFAMKKDDVNNAAKSMSSKCSQTDIDADSVTSGLSAKEEKFTQTIDVPDFLDDQERKDKKRLEEKYRMLKIKYNKMKRKNNATVIAAANSDSQQQQQQQPVVATTANITSNKQLNNVSANNTISQQSDNDDNYRYSNNNDIDMSTNRALKYDTDIDISTNNRPMKYDCLESLKNNLRKIDAMIDLVPSSQTDTLHYKYPFKDVLTDDEDISTAGSDLSYIRHRVHIEQKSVTIARNALRREEERIRNKLKRIVGLDQLSQEQDSLTEAEVELHRARSLLQEKTIRLRHMEASLRHLTSRPCDVISAGGGHWRGGGGPSSSAGGASCDTLSDISSQSSGPPSQSDRSNGAVKTARQNNAGATQQQQHSGQRRMPSAFNNDDYHHQAPAMQMYPAMPTSMILCPGVYVPTNIALPGIQPTSPSNLMQTSSMPYHHSTTFNHQPNAAGLFNQPRSGYHRGYDGDKQLNDLEPDETRFNNGWEDGLQWLREWMNRKDHGNNHDQPNIRIETIYPKKSLRLRKQSV